MEGGPRSAADRAVAAERAGFDQFWISNDFLGRSGLVGLTVAATQTDRIKLGLGVVDPVTLHPGQIAMYAAEMQELSAGRFLLGIGAGSDVFFKHAGVVAPKPIRRTTDALVTLEALLSGGSPADSALVGDGWSVDHGRLKNDVEHPPPIYLGAMGPKMLGLAGQLADGALPLCLPPSRVVRAREIVEAGAAARNRDLTAFDLVACIWSSIDDDPALARHHLARQIAQYSGSLSPRALADEGFDPEEFQMVQKVVLDDGLDAGAESVSDAMLTLGVYGGPTEVLDQIEHLASLGAGHISFGPPLGPDINRALTTFGTHVLPVAKQRFGSPQ